MLHLFLLIFLFVVAWQNLFIFMLPAFSSAAEIYIHTLQSLRGQFVGDACSILKWTRLESFFHHINELCQNIKFTKVEESKV